MQAYCLGGGKGKENQAERGGSSDGERAKGGRRTGWDEGLFWEQRRKKKRGLSRQR